MPQEETPEVKEARRQMREGRAPLLERVRETYPGYLLARKAYNRKHEEVREQLGLLNATFSGSIKRLRESSKDNQQSGEGMIVTYEALSEQAKKVAAFIEKELPGLKKLYEPVGKAFAAYQGALDALSAFMETWRGKLPESDFSGRALELVQTEIEKSLR